MKWPLTFYVDELPNNFAGVANGPVIRILKSHKDDEGLYKHEVEHVRQWFLTLTLHSLLYPLVTKYRLWSEAKAYAVQVDYGGELDLMAYRMALPVYDLDITQAQAKQEINKHLS